MGKTRRAEIVEEPAEINGIGKRAFLEDWTNRYVGAEGGWGGGKTFVGALKLLTLHATNSVHGKAQGFSVPSALVGLDYKVMYATMVPQLEELLDRFRWRRTIKRSAGEIHLLDFGTRDKPSIIYVRSANQPQSITGWQVGAAWGDEPARWPEDAHNPKNDPMLQLQGRVRHRGAFLRQVLYTSTHEGDHTRFYEWFYSGKPNRAIYRLPTIENKANLPQEYIDDLMQLPDDLRTQYVEGRAISLRGALVYGAFDAAFNVDDSIKPLPNLPMCFFFDFNIAPGMHAYVGQYDPAGDMFRIYYEITGPRMDVTESVQAAVAWLGGREGWCWPELMIYGDTSGHSETAQKGGQSYYDLIIHLCDLYLGVSPLVYVPYSHPPVSDRILAMNLAFCDPFGKRHFVCTSQCRKLIEDFRRLHRDDRGKIDERNTELKHASDAIGYGVVWVRPVNSVFHRPKVGGRFNV